MTGETRVQKKKENEWKYDLKCYHLFTGSFMKLTSKKWTLVQ